MKKKLIPLILALVCALCCAFGLAACGDGGGDGGDGDGNYATITYDLRGENDGIDMMYSTNKVEKGETVRLQVYFSAGYNHSGFVATKDDQVISGAFSGSDDDPNGENVTKGRYWQAEVTINESCTIMLDATACTRVDVTYVVTGLDDLQYALAVTDGKIHTNIVSCLASELTIATDGKITIPYDENVFLFSTTEVEYLTAKYETLTEEGYSLSAGSIRRCELDGHIVKYQDKFVYYFDTTPGRLEDAVVCPYYNYPSRSDIDTFSVFFDEQIFDELGTTYYEAESYQNYEFTLDGQTLSLSGTATYGSAYSQYCYVQFALTQSAVGGTYSIQDTVYYIIDESALGTSIENCEFTLTQVVGNGKITLTPRSITSANEPDKQLYCLVLNRSAVEQLVEQRNNDTQSFVTGDAYLNVTIKQSVLDSDYVKFTINENTSTGKVLCYSPSVDSGATFYLELQNKEDYHRAYTQVNSTTDSYEYYFAKSQLFGDDDNMNKVMLKFWPNDIESNTTDRFISVAAKKLIKPGSAAFIGTGTPVQFGHNRCEIPLVGDYAIKLDDIQGLDLTFEVTFSRKGYNGFGSEHKINLERLDLSVDETLYITKNRTLPLNEWIEITQDNKNTVDLTFNMGERWYYVVVGGESSSYITVQGSKLIESGGSQEESLTPLVYGYDYWYDLMGHSMKLEVEGEQYYVCMLVIPYGYYEDYTPYLYLNK